MYEMRWGSGLQETGQRRENLGLGDSGTQGLSQPPTTGLNLGPGTTASMPVTPCWCQDGMPASLAASELYRIKYF